MVERPIQPCTADHRQFRPCSSTGVHGDDGQKVRMKRAKKLIFRSRRKDFASSGVIAPDSMAAATASGLLLAWSPWSNDSFSFGGIWCGLLATFVDPVTGGRCSVADSIVLYLYSVFGGAKDNFQETNVWL